MTSEAKAPVDDARAENTDEAHDAARPAGPRRVRSKLLRWRVVVPALALTASATVFAVLYFTQYRADQQTGDAAAASAVRAASEATVSLLSYKPDTLQADLAAAKSHLTGEFLDYYSKFSDEILMPAARDREVMTSASVVRAADAEIHADTAKVLVFVNQTTTSRERPEPAQNASSVMVSLAKVDGRWLMSAFDPI
ncbi:twin-arginine translocation pathway signal [Mycobacterium sp. PS03-16]|uniref:twin-arginine translocation pathway signal n=1 Tax=Mycobacterium sp. PS03-16 TaxID=2559611 RepID=UPI001FD86B1B|nr:twin-arginine translocation pathway signal [Mycobacterium sp. PS03-16]